MKNTLKKLLSLALASLMCFSLAACSSGVQKADMTSKSFQKYMGHTKEDVFEFLGISEADAAPAEFVSGITLKDRFKYNGCEAEVTIDFANSAHSDKFVMITYQFGTKDKSGEDYQKAAFDYAKKIEKKLASEYEAVEYYNGDLNELSEAEYKADVQNSTWHREYHTDDKFGVLELFQKASPEVKWNELHLIISIEKIDVNDDKIAKVNVGFAPATKVTPQ